MIKYGKAESSVVNPVITSSTAFLESGDTSEDLSPQGLATPNLAGSDILPIGFSDSDEYMIPPTSSPSNSKYSFGSDSESNEDRATSSEGKSITNGNFPEATYHNLGYHPDLPESDDDLDEIPLLEDPLFCS